MDASTDDFIENNLEVDEDDGEECNTEEEEINKAAAVESLEPSVGWIFPKVRLAVWNPEDEQQWKSVGEKIARRNLIVSVPNHLCCFGVWLVWSAIAAKILQMHDQDSSVFPFDDWGSPQGTEYQAILFLLPGVAGLSGATLRISNSFLTQVCGGRNVVYSTSILLCVPMIITGIVLSDINCPFNALLACAFLSGVGGGAFASSMINISSLYPKRLQGMALGYNGGLGNLGVSVSQLLAPIVMSKSFGRAPIAPSGIEGWPANAGWLWLPLCSISTVVAFIYMSNHPDHGEKRDIVSLIYFYWMEIMGFLASFISIITFIFTRKHMNTTAGEKIAHVFLLVLLAAFCGHLFVIFSPKKARQLARKQTIIFKRKHTYIMTYLYIMSFGSFIGYSGSFPMLIVRLFGYLNECVGIDGAMNMTTYTNMAACTAAGGTWEVNGNNPNPHSPNGAAVAWLGAFVGSLIRPFGGWTADKYGGAKMTQYSIVWTTAAAFGQGAIVQICDSIADPTKYYGVFVFLFICLFMGTGFMNGTTFRTIGVLFPPEEKGPVLGWSSAIASYGAFVMPTMFGVATKESHHHQLIFYGLGGYYVTCLILNYWYYLRHGCEKPNV